MGPAEGLPKEEWKLKSPKEILALKVCDMAMGSGAFLVQACRYLAERLVEAWENEEKAHPGQVLITPEGKFSEGAPTERLVPAEAAERIAIARRVVADRCLYGVDINPMAVEMAKLSMWLITVDANRPFTFLDHAFKCGDSLLGITSLEQLENFSLRPGGGKQQAFDHLQPELGTLCLRQPQAQHLLLTTHVDPDGQVHRLDPHRCLAHLRLDAVEVDDGKEGIQRAGLPGLTASSTEPVTGEIRRGGPPCRTSPAGGFDSHAPSCHGAQRDDLVIKAVPGGLALWG